MTSGKLWGGRFGSAQAPELEALSRSEPAYFELFPYDARATIAHARALHRAGILEESELATVVDGLEALIADYRAGVIAPAPQDEDVHGFLERVLGERIGPVAGKVRAGRSRNDQAANDLRLYLRDQLNRVQGQLSDLIEALVEQARAHLHTVAPGFTHLQPGQPISFGHQLLAHAHAFSRDIERLAACTARADRSPLGAAALAGSAVVHSSAEIAEELGYADVCANSMDAVSSRDHVAECLFGLAMSGVNLSRLAEEVSMWVSHQFGWAELDDAYATGSSIMPQKKNPDIAELTRGRAGRLVGNLMGLLTAMKALPLAYNRDLFEDKHQAFDSVDTMVLVLPAMTGLIRTLRFDADRMRADASARFTLATEVADALSRAGVPFSEAHEITGRLVRHCEERGCDLPDLTPDDASEVDPRIDAAVLDGLSPEAALRARNGPGGTAPERVGEQLGALEAWLSETRQRLATADQLRAGS